MRRVSNNRKPLMNTSTSRGENTVSYRPTPQRAPLIIRGSEWKRDAACGEAVREGLIDPDAFFEHSGTKESAHAPKTEATRAAARVCAGCAVRVECSEESETPHPGTRKLPEGIWGGATEMDRKRERHARNARKGRADTADRIEHLADMNRS